MRRLVQCSIVLSYSCLVFFSGVVNNWSSSFNSRGLQTIKSLWKFFTSEIFKYIYIYISFSVKPNSGYRTNLEKINILGNFSVFPTHMSGTRQSRFGSLLCT